MALGSHQHRIWLLSALLFRVRLHLPSPPQADQFPAELLLLSPWELHCLQTKTHALGHQLPLVGSVFRLLLSRRPLVTDPWSPPQCRLCLHSLLLLALTVSPPHAHAHHSFPSSDQHSTLSLLSSRQSTALATFEPLLKKTSKAPPGHQLQGRSFYLRLVNSCCEAHLRTHFGEQLIQ